MEEVVKVIEENTYCMDVFDVKEGFRNVNQVFAQVMKSYCLFDNFDLC